MTELFIAHRPVGGPKVYCSSQKLANAAPGANRLVINLNVWMQLVILVKPFGINRVGEGSARAVHQHRIALRLRYAAQTQEQRQHCHSFDHDHYAYPPVKSYLALLHHCYSRISVP